MELTPQQRHLQELITDLCHRWLTREYIESAEENELYPEAFMKRLAEQGVMSMLVPPEYGGTGSSVSDIGVVVETLSYHWLAVGQAFYSMYVLGADAIARLGSASQKERYLSGIAEGRTEVAFALTEPDAGSDARAVRTQAVRKDGCFEITGQKTFITGARRAQVMITVVRTKAEPVPNESGLTLLLVDPKQSGIRVRPFKKLGLKPLDLDHVAFERVLVPADHLLGPLHRGWEALREGLTRERYFLAMVAVGAAQRAVHLAFEHARSRVQFGRPIGSFQMIQEKLVDMQMAVDASRLLARRAGWLLDQGFDSSREAAMAKIFASETYSRVAREASQIFGGSGFIMESEIQRHYRDCRYLEVGGGTSEVLRLLVARQMNLK